MGRVKLFGCIMGSYSAFSFHVSCHSQKSRARCGVLSTPHGQIKTPAFIFCATKAAMKSVAPDDMKAADTQIILSNTYHLLLQPGGALIEKMGGLHQFMGWDGPMLTDSGGFQIFSLGHGSVASEIKGVAIGGRRQTLSQITEEGARFQSYIDGRYHTLTPEISIAVQRQLGADLIVVLDECTPYHVDKAYTERSMHLSHRWALRSLQAFKRTDSGKQALYGIVQGGVYADLRCEAAQFINEQDFFGQAIGGSLGADKTQMYDVVATTMSHLNPQRPTHLLGIGSVRDIFAGVRHGIDTFDCVHPTRLARHGGALVRAAYWENEAHNHHDREHINLKNACFREDDRPIDSTCGCRTCQQFSRAYLHHLLKAKEALAYQAITIHNVYYMNRLLTAIRLAIATDTLEEEAKQWCLA